MPDEIQGMVGPFGFWDILLTRIQLDPTFPQIPLCGAALSVSCPPVCIYISKFTPSQVKNPMLVQFHTASDCLDF